MMASGARFIEHGVTFSADPALALPDLRPITGATVRLPELAFRTVYFDTQDFRIWLRGMTLCHQSNGGPGLWRLTLPNRTVGKSLGGDVLTWVGDPQSLPAEATRLLRGVLRRRVPGAIAELGSVRRRLTLANAEGTRVGELSDESVTVIGGERDGRRFRRVQVEVDSGVPLGKLNAGTSILGAVVSELEKAGLVRVHDSQLTGALELPVLGSAYGSVAGLDRSASLGDLVRASIADGLDRILDHDSQLRLGPGEPASEDVHQARVATRRLRSDLETFGAALDPVWLRKTRTELAWLAEALGRVRDDDILSLQLTGRQRTQTIPASAGDGLGDRLAAERRRSVRHLEEVLSSDRYVTLLDRLAAAARRPPFLVGSPAPTRGSFAPSPDEPASAVLRPMVDERRRALRRMVRKSGRQPSDRRLHRIRIRSKQLRYAAELAEPIFGLPARRMATSAQKLQAVLGKHHDAVAAEAWLHSVASAPSLAGFDATKAMERPLRRQRRARRRWWKDWKTLDGRKRRAWLR